ncbi:TIGR02453 family protein [Chitinophagaceae bacterium IBVUCB2]|nr:TIGR02453 family protein [Chitinophagaceae bacterium IBVUCB2]
MLSPSTIKFLKDLKKNNNRPWFEANRAKYDTAKADFANFIQAVIDQHGKKDVSIKNIVAKDCLFRINRDVRFSKDKSPYKSNFGASINKSGKKAEHSAGYYFQVQPQRNFAGGGIWMPEPNELKKVRQEIDYNFADFKKIISSRKFKSIYGDLDRSEEFLLRRVPKGYEPDNPAADYLKLKSFVGISFFSDADLISKDLVKKTVAAFEALQPVIQFINNSME